MLSRSRGSPLRQVGSGVFGCKPDPPRWPSFWEGGGGCDLTWYSQHGPQASSWWRWEPFGSCGFAMGGDSCSWFEGHGRLSPQDSPP